MFATLSSYIWAYAPFMCDVVGNRGAGTIPSQGVLERVGADAITGHVGALTTVTRTGLPFGFDFGRDIAGKHHGVRARDRDIRYLAG